MTLLDGIAAETFLNTNLPVLETGRLVLRAPRVDDAEQIALLINDRRIAENTARIPHPYTLADAEGFIASANREDGRASFVTTLADGTIIGGCGVGVLSGTDPEIGYWLGVPYWGNGYATEVARAVIDHAFTNLGYERLEAGARVSNPASRRVLEKCGFQWTGVILQRVRAINSAAPSDRFRLDRGLWASLKSWGNVRRAA
jgi:RimJ/RimL family protein N-acetyltransferase